MSESVTTDTSPLCLGEICHSIQLHCIAITDVACKTAKFDFDSDV